MNIQIKDVPLYIYISDLGLKCCRPANKSVQSCQVKGSVPTIEVKMTTSSSTKISGYNLVGMFPKLAVDSDIFPNSSDMTLPGETLQVYISSSISWRDPTSLSVRDGFCDDRIRNGAALKIVNGGNRSRI